MAANAGVCVPWSAFLRVFADCIDADYDLVKEARVKLKEWIAKNDRRHTQNLTKAAGMGAGAGTGARKRDIDGTLVMTQMSTASNLTVCSTVRRNCVG